METVTDRYGFVRIKERVLTIQDEKPVLLSFDEAIAQIENQTEKPEHEKLLEVNLIIAAMPKLYPYQGRNGRGNRELHPAKIHAVEHRALWVPDLSDVVESLDGPRHVTGFDLTTYPALRELLADPDSQYRDLKAERSGHVTLRDVDMPSVLPWEGVTIDDPEKRISRESIAARLEMAPWEKTSDIELVLLTQDEATGFFGEAIPDGQIPATAELMRELWTRAKSGFGMRLHSGDKVRGAILPFKGTLKRVNLPGRVLYLVEGGALKVTLTPETERRIHVSASEVEAGAFGVETPSLERVLHNPRFGIHALASIVGMVRARDPEAAKELVPVLHARDLRLARGEGTVLDYLDLCTFPVPSCDWDPVLTRHYCAEILERKRAFCPRDSIVSIPAPGIEVLSQSLVFAGTGEILDPELAGDIAGQLLDPDPDVEPIQVDRDTITIYHNDTPHQVRIAPPGLHALRGDVYRFGLKTAARYLLQGLPVTYEPVWEALSDIIAERLSKRLRRRVKGIGGMAQASPHLKYGEVLVSSVLGKLLGKVRTGCLLYWPSKFPHFLHRVKVTVEDSLDGSCLVVHPDILDSLAGDSDGDLLFLITEKSIVKYAREIDSPCAGIDRRTQQIIVYPDMVEMVTRERQETKKDIRSIESLIEAAGFPADIHQRAAMVNDGTRQIGLSFIMRDMIMDTVGWENDLVNLRFGEVCHTALGGLKVARPMSVVSYLESNPGELASLLGIDVEQLPYTRNYGPWSTNSVYRDMYRAMCRRDTSLDELIRCATLADPESHSVFEWILAHTPLKNLVLPALTTSEDLAVAAERLLSDAPTTMGAGDARFYISRTARAHILPSGALVDHPVPGSTPARYNPLVRVRHMLACGVNPNSLRAVILKRASEDPQAIEALGLLVALREVQTTAAVHE